MGLLVYILISHFLVDPILLVHAIHFLIEYCLSLSLSSQNGGCDEDGVCGCEADEDHVDGRLHLRPAQHHDRYHVPHQAQQTVNRNTHALSCEVVARLINMLNRIMQS